MYLADDSMIYLDALYAKCRSTPPSSPSSSSSAAQSEMTQPFRPVLILIPVRIGLEKPNDIYIPALREVFQYPQCIGIIGGRPRASLYFIAAQGVWPCCLHLVSCPFVPLLLFLSFSLFPLLLFMISSLSLSFSLFNVYMYIFCPYCVEISCAALTSFKETHFFTWTRISRSSPWT